MTMQRCQARDLFTLSSRRITDEGFLVAPGVLARTGVQEYHPSELGMKGDKRLRLYRPSEEVFAADAIASFEGKPVTLGHPAADVTADNWRELAVGDVRDVKQANDKHVAGTLTIRDRQAVRDVLDRKKDALSNGYAFDLDLTPGKTSDGADYDGVQRNIRGNHVAIVDTARGGPACRIADNEPRERTMALKKITVADIDLEVEETQASFIKKAFDDAGKATKKAEDALAASTKRATDAEAALAAEKEKTAKLVTDHAAAVAALTAKIPTAEQIEALAADRATVVTDAVKLLPDYKAEGKSVQAIRSEVVTEVMAKDEILKPLAAAVLKGADVTKPESAALVEAAFSALATMKKTAANDGADRGLGADLAGSRAAGPTGAAAPKLVGRDAFMARNANGGKLPEAAKA